jgi:DegV family protein with EDD domain
MTRIAIVTDSSADLSPAIAARASITIVPAGPGVLYSGAESAAPSSLVERFSQVFSELSRTHDSVVAVLLSERLGSVAAGARAARDRLSTTAPGERTIEIIDSRSASLGLGFQVMRAAELSRLGAGTGEIAAELRANTDRYHVVFSVESLEHLRTRGRIGRSAAKIAEALQLKPLLRIDEGQIVPYERARTRAGAEFELAEFVRTLPAVERCAVLYASNHTDALGLLQAISTATDLPPERITVQQIGETIAAQVGPGALGVAVVETAIP